MAVALVHFSLLSPDLQTKGATARPFQAPRLLHKASGVILEMQQSHKRIGSSFPFTLYLRVWRERPARHGDPECLPCSAPTASSFSRNNQAAGQHTRPTEDQTGWRSSWGGGGGGGGSGVCSGFCSSPALGLQPCESPSGLPGGRAWFFSKSQNKALQRKTCSLVNSR